MSKPIPKQVAERFGLTRAWVVQLGRILSAARVEWCALGGAAGVGLGLLLRGDWRLIQGWTSAASGSAAILQLVDGGLGGVAMGLLGGSLGGLCARATQRSPWRGLDAALGSLAGALVGWLVAQDAIGVMPPLEMIALVVLGASLGACTRPEELPAASKLAVFVTLSGVAALLFGGWIDGRAGDRLALILMAVVGSPFVLWMARLGCDPKRDMDSAIEISIIMLNIFLPAAYALLWLVRWLAPSWQLEHSHGWSMDLGLLFYFIMTGLLVTTWPRELPKAPRVWVWPARRAWRVGRWLLLAGTLVWWWTTYRSQLLYVWGSRSTGALAVTADGTVAFSPVEEGKILAASLTGHGFSRAPVILDGANSLVRCLAISRDGRWLISGGGTLGEADDGGFRAADCAIRVWHIGDEQLHRRILTEPKWPVDGLALTNWREEPWLVACDRDGVRAWELLTGRMIWHLGIGLITDNIGITSVAIGPDDRTLLTGRIDGRLSLGELETGLPLLHLEGHSGAVRVVEFSPDARRAMSAGEDGTVRLWDLRRGIELWCFTGHSGPVYSVAFSPDGRRAVSGGDDGTIRLWSWDEAAGDVRHGRELARYRGHRGPVRGTRIIDQGKKLVSSSVDGIRVWRLPDHPRAEAPARTHTLSGNLMRPLRYMEHCRQS
jgi:WD40 repeat protein